MRGRLQAAAISVGIGASLLILVLGAAIILDSTLLLIIGGALALVVVWGLCFLVERIGARYSEVLNQLITKVNGTRHRIGDQNFHCLEEALDQVPAKNHAIQMGLQSVKDETLALRRQLKVLRRRVPSGFMEPVQQEIEKLKSEGVSLLRTTFESGIILDRDPLRIITRDQARVLFDEYLSKNDLLQLRPLIEKFDLLSELNLSTLRKLYRFYRETGYWDLASKVIERIHSLSELESDANAALKLKHENEVFSHPEFVTVNLPDGQGYDPDGPVLHMVGRVLPKTQTGYTLRTHYTALAQAKRGFRVAVVGQAGITDRNLGEIENYEFDGVNYYLLPGPARNRVLLDEWLRINVVELARLVREVQPSILHAQSDFFNALIVSLVGQKYEIPTVYEVRGFWEYSWLSRAITTHGWDDSERLFEMYGLPAAYEYRRDAEKYVRTLPNHVFTLAEVMKNHILDSSDGEISSDSVTIVPNAVEASNFPVQTADSGLADKIGLPRNSIIIGYISSMVEYEGIDTLIDAFVKARQRSTQPMSLLLVGDGDYLPQLKQKASEVGESGIFFMGRVSHEKVLQYYGLIDIFVVPRKQTTVTNLVTPLKPFEAFSTGRAVILSDVDALREIAEQSKAVETFRANDPEDLAQKIVDLGEDPAKRANLGRKAARWVRNYRSWDRNINEYYRVYKALGYEGPRNSLIEAELVLQNRGLNPGELVEDLTQTDLAPQQGWFTLQDTDQSASSILREGWRFESFDPIKIFEIQNWTRYSAEHRSWGFHLHAWEFMDPLLVEYDLASDVKWLDAAIQVALKWITFHCGSEATDDPMVWYDMSLALRMPRLIALVARSARTGRHHDETLIMAAAIIRHFDELSMDRAFNSANNHGFYTAISQVHASKYLHMFNEAKAAASQGEKRLEQMTISQFAEDGTHREHSPAYHQMLLKSFELAIKDELITDGEIKERIKRAAHVLGWMIQPDGTLVQFGDTQETTVLTRHGGSVDPETQYILSDGALGQKPVRELGVFRTGGYAFVRSPQPETSGSLHKSSYLAFNAAFHSRAHKHADDLNLVWYDREQQILTDGGRYGYGELLPPDSPLRKEGYYYQSPARQYIEGTIAHNTLMMDGKNQDRRSREPYGSGILECVEREGVFDLTGRVQHLDYVHRRRVVFRPGRELLLKDAVYSQSPEERDAIIWINIAGHFELEEVDEHLVFASERKGKITRLRIDGPGELIKPVRGQDHPMRGWRSRQDQAMEPTWSVGFTFPIETRASVSTRLRFLD